MDPMHAVRAALDAGARTRKDITAATSLDVGVVDATVDLMLRLGTLDVHQLKLECGAGGCRNCVQDSTCAPATGPVPLRLRKP